MMVTLETMDAHVSAIIEANVEVVQQVIQQRPRISVHHVTTEAPHSMIQDSTQRLLSAAAINVRQTFEGAAIAGCWRDRCGKYLFAR